MGVFRKIVDYFNREIQLNKEYYESLKEEAIVFDEITSNKGHNCTNNLYEQAVDIIFECGQASASILERHLKISFNSASEILNYLVSKGIISELNGSIPRKILVNNVSQAKEMLNRPISKIQPIKDFDPGTQVRTDTTTVYYAYGHVLKVFPPPPGSYYENRDIINSATFIVSDGVAYDLTDKKSIYSIKVPNYNIYAPHKIGEELGATGYLEYVLRMHSGLCWNAGEYDIATACLEKATELMKYSTMGWPKKDFYRIVNRLYDLGKFKKAEEWKMWIDNNIPSIEETVSENVSKSREILDADLVIVEDHCNMCCEMCAKYRKRVYSTSGKDFRFPRFPKNFHLDCGLSVHPFVYGVNEPSSFTCKDIIAYSNRPFEDDRMPEEINRHNEMIERRENEARKEREAKLSKIIYCKLKAVLPPEDIPKSVGGFSRMRNANSKNYQTLVKKAEAAGFVFPQTLEDVKNWPENQ